MKTKKAKQNNYHFYDPVIDMIDCLFLKPEFNCIKNKMQFNNKINLSNKMFGNWEKTQRNQKKQLFQQKFKTRIKYSQPDQRVQTL